MNDATSTTALESLTLIAREIAAYRGGLAGWAYSPDAADQWVASALRNRCVDLAKLVAADVDLAERTAVALAWACMGDDYAVKELAGRFRSMCARMRLVAAIRRHPRAGQFGTLIAAIERGKFTKAQIEFARKLAGEALAA